MEEVVVAEVDGILQEGVGGVGLHFLDNFLGLSGDDESEDVVVDWVAHLLFFCVAHEKLYNSISPPYPYPYIKSQR